MLDQNQVSLIFPLALDSALPISYCASKSVQPFGFCRYISSWKSRCLKLCLKKHGENFKIFFSLWGPLTPNPLDRMHPKSVRYNHIHPWACLRNFVPIAQYLREVMAWRTHSPRSGRRKTKKNKNKKSQNNCLESHVWSQISGKPVERKIWFFF